MIQVEPVSIDFYRSFFSVFSNCFFDEDWNETNLDSFYRITYGCCQTALIFHCPPHSIWIAYRMDPGGLIIDTNQYLPLPWLEEEWKDWLKKREI